LNQSTNQQHAVIEAAIAMGLMDNFNDPATSAAAASFPYAASSQVLSSITMSDKGTTMTHNNTSFFNENFVDPSSLPSAHPVSHGGSGGGGGGGMVVEEDRGIELVGNSLVDALEQVHMDRVNSSSNSAVL
jgi:hypothetical protein